MEDSGSSDPGSNPGGTTSRSQNHSSSSGLMRTNEVIMEDGTFRTGYLVRLVDGLLKITGSVKEQLQLQTLLLVPHQQKHH